VISLISSIIIFDGCNGASVVPSGQKVVVDKTLPKVTLTKRGIVTDMNEVAFEWRPIKDPRVEGVKIYKSTQENNESLLLTTIENRYSTHYVDLDVVPNTMYKYSLRTYKGDKVSRSSGVKKIYTKPVLPSVSWIYAVNGLPRMAKLLWRPHKNPKVESYIIERKSIDDDEWVKIAEVEGRLQAEYIDKDLKDKFTYRYRVKVKTFDDIISTPSKIVKVVTKPLPPEILNLQASTDLPRKIFLTWQKSHYKDFYQYYLYRSDEKDGSYELIAKLFNNRFTDNIEKDGAR
jgi:fibronectin type 3 domain-containing protein